MAGPERIAALVRRHLTPSAVTGLGPALAVAARLDVDVIALSAAAADRPGLLLLTPNELRFVTADALDEASAVLDRMASVEVATYEGRPVLIVLASDSRRTMFQVGDPAWTRLFASWVNLALDDPGAAVMAVDRHLGDGPVGAAVPPSPGRSAGLGREGRPARERLRELEDLRREGVLTAAEYAAQRATIISEV